MRKNNFDFLHMFGALGVMLGHQFIFCGQWNIPMFLGMEIQGLSVYIIFTISGYLVTESFFRSRNAGAYLVRRITRIYPEYAVCVLFMVAYGAFFTTVPVMDYFRFSGHFTLYNLLMSPVFGLPGVFEANFYPVAVNGSLWTLPIELACYLLVIPVCGFIGFLRKKGANRIAATAAVLLFAVVYAGYLVSSQGRMPQAVAWGTDWLNASRIAVFFLAGSLMSAFALKKYCKLQVAVALILVEQCLPQSVQIAVNACTIPYFVISFAYACPPQVPCLGGRIGKQLCYGIYLYAFPIQQGAIQILALNHGFVNLSPYVYFAISLPFVFLAAFLGNRLVYLLSPKKKTQRSGLRAG